MNMDEVQEILKKHDALLDAMSAEERIKYYENYGMKINPSKIENEAYITKETLMESCIPIIEELVRSNRTIKHEKIAKAASAKPKKRIKLEYDSENNSKKQVKKVTVTTIDEDEKELEQALRRFKRSCAKSGVLEEVRKREFYEKPSVNKKKKTVTDKKNKNENKKNKNK